MYSNVSRRLYYVHLNYWKASRSLVPCMSFQTLEEWDQQFDMLSGKRLVCQLLEHSCLNHHIYSVNENNLWSSSHTEECRCNRNSQLHLDLLCFEFILVKHNFNLFEAVTESGEMARPDLNLELFRAQVLKSDEVPYFNAWGKTI